MAARIEGRLATTESGGLATAEPGGLATAEPGWLAVLAGAFARNPLAITGGILLLMFVVVAAAAPWLMPYDPIEQDMFNADAPPSAEHWLGTDQFGRDVLSRLMLG